MSEDLVTIEVDGRELQARKGSMLIEVTDRSDIYIPRFCYHEKLSVAANCRMCLVEVEKAPKPLPACATPVMDGMKVHTQSQRARDAQRATMEFLLINHPLDCPICDQGGECELQDLALGYGSDVSRYSERKRVVRDKNIGPLIQTDMTRCIHCTRCVRFGEEVAGLKELGATGRGEHMEIGTYVAKAVSSELSGNVIDLCPVGALTSKPYRYSARAWELRQSDGVAPHDCIGSNVYVHAKGSRVKRVVPRHKEAINETWISDRDRYSYEGLYHEERLTVPLLRDGDRWREVDWETALRAASAGLKSVLTQAGADQIGALLAPSSTVEEAYLVQKLMRTLGSGNIDHRLRQRDFSDQEAAPVFPALGQTIADLESLDAALLIGSNVRKEQPLLNHRLRKAGLHGADLMVINPVDFDNNWSPAHKCIVSPARMVEALAAVAVAAGVDSPCLQGIRPSESARQMAAVLREAGAAALLLGSFAGIHPQAAQLRALAAEIAAATGARVGQLTDGPNSAGAALAGALPHRDPFAVASPVRGLDAQAMLESRLKAYLLLGLEPELDCWDGRIALAALEHAEFVVALTAFRTANIERYAKLMLPMALFAETSGTYVNAAGDWQGFAGSVEPPGEARPAWKILRVLGNHLQLDGFDFQSSADVVAELKTRQSKAAPAPPARRMPEELALGTEGALIKIRDASAYRSDALVRRAKALQATADALRDGVFVHPEQARRLGMHEGDPIRLAGSAIEAVLHEDARVAMGCVYVVGATAAADLGPLIAEADLARREEP